MYISIHAPTRGATKKAILQREKQAISIHAPTRGATVFRRAERNSCRISIHAPTRGATIPNIDIPDVAGFQSTLPREERLSFPCNISFHLIFQSTLPREERQTMRKLTIAELNFNPRSHERSDGIVLTVNMIFVISIHAPTRGATDTDSAMPSR